MSKSWKAFSVLAVTMTIGISGTLGYGCWQTANSLDGSVAFKVPKVDHAAFLEAEKVSAAILKESEKRAIATPDPLSDLAVPTDTAEYLQSNEEKMYVLALGVDSRGDDLKGRSDSIIVLSIDKKSNSVDMISIPRDAYVNIVGKGKNDKINHAYAFGGTDMAQKTVENLLGVKFDHTVVFNFKSFISVIDVLGGIEVDVPFDFTEQNSQGKHGTMVFKKGKQVLSGEEALAFARMRKKDPEGDIGRGKRQQQVIKAVVTKLTTGGSIQKYNDVYKRVTGSMETDITAFDLIGLSTYLSTFQNIEQHRLTGTGITISGIYYMELYDNQLSKVKQVLK